MDEKIEETIPELSIEQLFAARDKIFHECTQTIVKRLGYVLDAIVDVLQIDSAILSWEAMDIREDMLVLFGKVEPANTPPEKIRIVTIGIPMSIVNSGDKTEIASFLRNNCLVEDDKSGAPGMRSMSAMEKTKGTQLPPPSRKETAIEYVQRGNTQKRTIH